MCNIGSVVNMVRRVGGQPVVLSTPREECRFNKVILPGLGAFDAGLAELHDSGWKSFLQSRHEEGSAPLLGICLGMQMLFDASEEGKASGIGLIPGTVVRIPQSTTALRVPHMGWNEVNVVRNNALLDEPKAGARPPRFYFVHTYHAVCEDPQDVVATVDYGSRLTAVVNRGGVFGAQFHPEKSHRFGMDLIKRFLEI